MSIKQGGRVFPLLHGIQGGAAQKWWARYQFHGRDVPRRIDERINLNIAGNVLRSGHRRIQRWDGFKELRGFHVATNRERRGWFIAISGTNDGEGICAGGSRIRVDGG